MNNIEILNLDSISWDKIVKTFPNYDVYYLNGYVKPFMIHGDGEPYLLYYESDTLRAIYVFMKRSIDKTYSDIITPYGYGGVLFDGMVNEQTLLEFNSCFIKKMIIEGIVDNFIRFHPILSNADNLRSFLSVIDLGQTISMDLSSNEVIWQNISSKNRNMIRKAEKNGIVIKHGRDYSLFEDFIRIYNQTMDDDEAADYYYFDQKFYDSIYESLQDNYEIFFALLDGKIISMSIIIFANNKMHYHLSGSLSDYRKLAPTNLLLYKAACWGSDQGYETFHLGGGLGSGKDGLFKFKAAFNRNSGHQFSIGKQIFNKEKYDELVVERVTNDESFDSSSEFFPLYRG